MRRRSDARYGAMMPAVLVVAVALLLSACPPPEIDPDARRDSSGEALYHDGLYAAAFSHTGPEGWRPFVQVRVHAGLIQEVCINAVNSEGARLRDHERYLEQYRLDTGIDLETLFSRFVDEVLERQRPSPGVVPGGEEWAVAFELLVRQALEAATYGITVDAAGIEGIPTAGPFVARDAPDELGWRGELVLVYDKNGVGAGSYREVREELDGTTRDKRDDANYQDTFTEASGTTSATVADALIEQLLAAGSPDIDGVSGATVSSARFIRLATEIEHRRVAAALPNRFCE